MHRATRAFLTLVLLVALGGCEGRTPSDAPRSDGPALDAPEGVLVVNRSQQPISPAQGWVVRACGELFFEASTLRTVADRWVERIEGPHAPDAPREVAWLDAWYVPPAGRWFLLVTSTQDPQLFFDGLEVPSRLLADLPVARPRPQDWPPCIGRPRPGTVGVNG
jgi:hypothetical protein